VSPVVPFSLRLVESLVGTGAGTLVAPVLVPAPEATHGDDRREQADGRHQCLSPRQCRRIITVERMQSDECQPWPRPAEGLAQRGRREDQPQGAPGDTALLDCGGSPLRDEGGDDWDRYRPQQARAAMPDGRSDDERLADDQTSSGPAPAGLRRASGIAARTWKSIAPHRQARSSTARQRDHARQRPAARGRPGQRAVAAHWAPERAAAVAAALSGSTQRSLRARGAAAARLGSASTSSSGRGARRPPGRGCRG
jgi:hypothetical protein